MVDVSKRLSGSPKVQPKPKLAKKWMSEPNLLGDDEEQTWIKERDNMEEQGVSFTEDVPEPSRLVHINKQRVQLRPKRRPPTRDFVRSRASMDFDLAVPEDIEEEDEETEQNEVTEIEEDKEVPPPVRPSPPPKPMMGNGWRLPTPTSEVVLRKTKPVESEEKPSEEGKSNENISHQVEVDNVHDITPESSPEKKHKGRKRFKPLQIFKFRRSRKGKGNGTTPTKEVEPKTNLTETHAMSVDSGTRPLGEESRHRLPNRRSRKSHERGLTWLLGLFHKRNSPESTEDTSKDNEGASKDAENIPTVNVNNDDANSNEKSEVNGTVPEVRIERELSNGHTSHEEEEPDQNPESVKDLRQKFEQRISAAF